MIFDMHTHAGKQRHTAPFDPSVLASMAPDTAQTTVADFARHRRIAAALRARSMTEDKAVCARNRLHVFRAART